MEIINIASIMGMTEIIGSIAASLTPILVAFFGYKGKVRFDKLTDKFNVFEQTNEKEHKKLNQQQSFINAREELSKSLRKVCVQSIAYTEGGDKINGFKDMFTASIMDLAEATISTGFKNLTQDLFRTYMVTGGKKIRSGYSIFNERFSEKIDVDIQKTSDIYYEKVLLIIKDTHFNDKNDRYVDLTIQFLRDELMLITKMWWDFNDIKSNYKVI